jgi:hypothetical protein
MPARIEVLLPISKLGLDLATGTRSVDPKGKIKVGKAEGLLRATEVINALQVLLQKGVLSLEEIRDPHSIRIGTSKRENIITVLVRGKRHDVTIPLRGIPYRRV